MLSAPVQKEIIDRTRKLVGLLSRFDTNAKHHVLTPRQAKAAKEKAWSDYADFLKEID